MRFTRKQQKVIDKVTASIGGGETGISDGGAFSISAVAGAGKSAIIVEMARREATQAALFLCHSQSIADRARLNLPRNIEVSTFYKAAKKFLGLTRPRKASERMIKRHTPDDLIRIMGTGVSYTEAERALGVLERFYRSAHPAPGQAHLPPRESWVEQTPDRNIVMDIARTCWYAQMRIIENDGLALSTTSIIKWWMLSHAESIYHQDCDHARVVAPIPSECRFIIVEEAQLLSVGLLDFLSRQRGSIIFFGDGYQSLTPGSTRLQHQNHPIYERTETLAIDESLRFGPSIASICSALASKAGQAEGDWVKGAGRSAVYTSQQRDVWEHEEKHYTVLAMQYESLFQEALEATHRGKVLAWLNGLENHPVVLLRDLAVLKAGLANAYPAPDSTHLIATPSLRSLNTLADVHQRYQRQPEALVARLACWVDGKNEPYLLRIIDLWRHSDKQRQNHSKRNMETPIYRDVTLGTVSQAIGHEWPRVALNKDLFPPALRSDTDWYAHPQAINFAYTASSRAKYGLAVPDTFMAHLKSYGWDVPEDSPGIDLQDGISSPMGGQHPYFGVDRYAKLELTPRSRQEARRETPKLPSSSQPSGQNSIRNEMLERARRFPSEGISGLRAVLKGH